VSTRPNSSTGSCHILRTRRSTKLACEHDADSDGVHLARAANIVRRDMMKMKTAFSGSFDALCQEQSVPNSLLALVAIILNGPTIQEQSCHSSASTPTLTISQVLVFNSYARRRQSTSIESLSRTATIGRPPCLCTWECWCTQRLANETWLTLFHLGLSVSYDRVLRLHSIAQLYVTVVGSVRETRTMCSDKREITDANYVCMLTSTHASIGLCI